MNAPAVSVVLPCYNAHAHLPQALDSLRVQTFRNFETIVVDDGSTDPDTRSLLDTLPDDVRVVRQENRGLAGARNRGFAEARADLVLPLDCDDWLAPEFLADACRALDGAPDRSFAFADLTLEGEASGTLQKPFNLFEQLFFNQLPYCMLIPRSAWVELGGYDEAMRQGYEDWEFNIRLGLEGYSGIPLAQPHFHYRVSSSGMLASVSRNRHVELWRYIRAKHSADYRMRRLFRLWRTWRKRPSTRPLVVYAIWELCYRVLPDRVLNRLFLSLRPLSHSVRAARRRAAEA